MRTLFRAFRACVFAFTAMAMLGSSPARAIVTNYVFGNSQDFTAVLILNGAMFLNSTSQGWYDDSGAHDEGNLNYITGAVAANNALYNDFFVFDLTGISGTINSATLSLFNPLTGFIGNPATYTNYDVSTSIPTLVNTNVGATSIYADLGSGNAYASTPVDSSLNNSTLDIILNAQALADIIAAEGASFAIGGTLISQIATPLPASLPLFGVLLAGLFGANALRKRRPVIA